MNKIPSEPKTISIVTPSYNQGEFIAETIESVISQVGDFYIDYIVVDACSTDNSLAIIRNYERLLREDEWKVNCLGINYRWICEKDNGQADGINKGFTMATGSVFGWLNSDDLYCAGAFQKVIKIDWRKTDFCYGQGMWINKRGDELGFYPTFTPNKYSLSLQCTLCQPTVFFSRETYNKLGEISVSYNFALDYEYWLKGVFAGMKFSRIPLLIAKSRMYKENKTLSYPTIANRERKALLERYYSSKSLNKFLLFIWKTVIEENTIKMNAQVLAIIQREH
jgi:glycosyltransferase involved in cell wall biosynthesis